MKNKIWPFCALKAYEDDLELSNKIHLALMQRIDKLQKENDTMRADIEHLSIELNLTEDVVDILEHSDSRHKQFATLGLVFGFICGAVFTITFAVLKELS